MHLCNGTTGLSNDKRSYARLRLKGIRFPYRASGASNRVWLWETEGMKKPELIDTGWLGPRSEMDRASHRFGKCSECHKIICVEKAVAEGPSSQRETSRMLDKAFRAHVELEHSNQD